MQILFLHWGGGGDNRSNFSKICNFTSLGGMIFQLSKKGIGNRTLIGRRTVRRNFPKSVDTTAI